MTSVVGRVPIIASDESVDLHVYDILFGDTRNIIDNFIRKIEGQIKRWFFIIDTLFSCIERCTVPGNRDCSDILRVEQENVVLYSGI